MPFTWKASPRPVVALAPMAGVTDASYRRFIRRLAPEVIVYSEFLSTDALAYGSKKTMKMMHFDPALERPFIVQIFGHSVSHFMEAAKIVEQMGADGIDINMGCPAAKIVSSCHGSALIKDPALAAELVAATVKAVSIPVSVKTRLGWSDTAGLIPFCRGLEAAGASALAIHGRRFCDKFTGAADWEPIYALKEAVSIPVIGNGDIRSAQDAVSKIRNLDGVMVGRGTFGNPWLMKEICEAFGRLAKMENGKWEMMHEPPSSSLSETLTFTQKIPFILEHCRLAISIKGEKYGMLEMRRHLSSYAKGFPGASDLRARLVRAEKLQDVEQLLAAF